MWAEAALILARVVQHLDDAAIRSRAQPTVKQHAVQRQEPARLRLERARAGGSVASFRMDIDPRLASRLGIDTSRQPSEREVAILNGMRADGAPIEGRQIQKPGRSLAEVFGKELAKAPLTGQALENVLAGRRADGSAPVDSKTDQPLSDRAVEGAIKRFTAACGVPSSRGLAPDPDELAHMRGGRMATGVEIDRGDYRRKMNARKEPIAYVDLVLSPPVSVREAEKVMVKFDGVEVSSALTEIVEIPLPAVKRPERLSATLPPATT